MAQIEGASARTISIAGNRKPATAILALVTTCLLTSSAFATNVEVAKLKAMSFTTQNVYNQVIEVVSTDNTKWDKIVPGSVSFGAHVMVDTRDHVFTHGWVDSVGILLGACGGPACLGKPLLWARNPGTKDYENQMAVTFPTSKIPVSSASGIATVPIGDDILRRCNDHQPGQEHSFDYLMEATFAVDTSDSMSRPDGTAHGAGLAPTWIVQTDYSLTKPFEVRIKCKGFEPAVSHSTPNPDPHRTRHEVTKLDLFLATVAQPAGSQHGPSGTQCKPIVVTTRIEADKAGPVNVKQWRQVNGGPITSENRAMNATALGGGTFGDDWVKIEHFAQTTTVQYKDEVIGGTFAPSTPWKSITIHCNGDFAAPQTNANPDNGNPPRGKPKGEVNLPPVVTPPACAGKSAKVRGSAHCVKTAQVPDKKAERKRKEAAEKRKAAHEAELRRRDAARESAAESRGPGVGHGPHRFGFRPAPHGPQRAVFRPQLIFTR